MSSKSIAYLNGEYVPAESARISPLDRGFIFGDGVYEMLPVLNGRLIHLSPHLDRLNQSLMNIRMTPPHTHAEWKKILETLLEHNGPGYYALYLQVTRGFERIRNHGIPKEVTPTTFAICFPYAFASKEELRAGKKAFLVHDIRWKLCHIKSSARLANVLMFQEAKDQGGDEGIVLDEGEVLEGISSNLFIVKNGVIITPPKSNKILSGITRECILELAKQHQIPYQEKSISETEFKEADEIWITSSIRGIHPIVEVEGKPVGSGVAGPVWEKLWDLYAEECANLSL